MPTDRQYRQVRYPLAADATTLPDAELDYLFEDAAVYYAGNEDAQSAWVGVQVCRNLRAQAAKRVDYKQNQSQEWLSQIFPRLKEIQKEFEDQLEETLTVGATVVRYGGIRRTVPRLIELPDDIAVGRGNADVSKLSENGQ